MSNTATDRRPIDAYAVALDQTLDYYIEPEDAPYIARIWEGYVFDRNQRTHCCELTPSYFLLYLQTRVELTDDGHALDDEARDRLCNRYEREPSDDCYVHCGDIERLIAKAEPRCALRYGDVEEHDFCDEIADADQRHDAEMERIREHLTYYDPPF